jgi:hypothetical protein
MSTLSKHDITPDEYLHRLRQDCERNSSPVLSHTAPRSVVGAMSVKSTKSSIIRPGLFKPLGHRIASGM